MDLVPVERDRVGQRLEVGREGVQAGYGEDSEALLVVRKWKER